jgi:mRNA-degrading endonuclease RelE of RelBE toxin-antitoxin system
VTLFRAAIPPAVADVIRHLHPDLKRSVKKVIRALCNDPTCGEPLQKELEGYWKYRHRRFRIVYSIDRANRAIRIVAVGSRRTIYEQAAEQLRERS